MESKCIKIIIVVTIPNVESKRWKVRRGMWWRWAQRKTLPYLVRQRRRIWILNRSCGKSWSNKRVYGTLCLIAFIRTMCMTDMQNEKIHWDDQKPVGKTYSTYSVRSLLLAPTGALIVMMVYYTAYNLLNFHSAHWCNWCNSKWLKQHECNWRHKMLIECQMFQFSNVPVFQCSNVPMF